ncbi:hypothetical protein ACFQI7_09125 [Paenibacillus allorhizosphaerae]|uniref:DUF4199 domain-containing protein n=1 Tax=Paenibacillus allorhizosphaerae TaxID=2849866 RepID=A0ABN7TKI7_9BACL|nr:hypothetical protein [Paenibacillus allorhizosphaerae]CAG7644029.1 hypothetical protein PAECIP111802_03137 [Paenibacillus allorhizosphaerae]
MRNRIVCVVSFAMCVISLLLVLLFTIPPTRISGNGNPGLLFVITALIFFAALLVSICIESVKLLAKSGAGNPPAAILSIALSLLIVVLVIAQIDYQNKLLIELGGDDANPNSKIYRFFILNQYTNTMFFNEYILCIGSFGSMMLGIFIYMIRTNG